MLAETVDALPTGPGWRFEPKWDGFRCLVHRDGASLTLRSKNQKPLERYFPELVVAFMELPASRFVIDGEILCDTFEQLQQRQHPAASRIARLSVETPARFMAFDMLICRDGRSISQARLIDRRAALDDFLKPLRAQLPIDISKSTPRRSVALNWLQRATSGIDGVIAKRADEPYSPGKRLWLKYKIWKTVDCIVGGVYWSDERAGIPDTLLLGLYDPGGQLHYVGHTRVHEEAETIGSWLRPLVGGSGFTGRKPPTKSRWTGKDKHPVSLEPRLVVEVSADHITGQHFRHGSRILRWRDDKDPQDCTLDQIVPRSGVDSA